MTSARIRLNVVFAGLAFAGLAFVAWTQPWFTVVLVDGTTVDVAGDAAAPALAALSLASLALFGSLTIAGPVLRAILAVLAIAIGTLIAGSSIGVFTDPIAAVASTVTSVTGVAGTNSVNLLIESIASTPWGLAAIVAGGCLVLAGIAILVTLRHWPRATSKYGAVRSGAAAEVASAAHISHEDQSQLDIAQTSIEPRSPIDDWDSLSNGDDPTRMR
ncbi:MAG: Trp biosynthesis-associated membrane protein [Salinibacterium sp.]|nr:Trp biosynthesis-associated membrane protein [Salinibacterium sp.]